MCVCSAEADLSLFCDGPSFTTRETSKRDIMMRVSRHGHRRDADDKRFLII